MKLPFFILGGGSNLLVSDEGYKGLVIKFGQPLSLYVPKGLEWATGIPGTLQGAVFGNAGAFGKSMKDVVKEVKVFDAKTEKIKNFKNKDCQFSYKNSIFRKKKIQSTKQSFVLGRAHKNMCSDLIILSVKIKSKKSNPKKIKEYFGYKKETQPLNFPSAGSIFRNFTPYRNEVSGAGSKESKELKKIKEKGMIPAAYLIDKCSLKGKRVGNVKISEKHANFIVNLGNGKAKDVKKLIKLIKNKVKKKFGVVLKEEIQIF